MKYVLVEGIDGAGKTTVAKKLFRQAGHRVKTHLTFEPTDGHYGLRARQAIETGDRTRFEVKGLFIQDRIQHFRRVIHPYLGQGHMVVQDRGFLSTVAYQSQDLMEIGEILDLHYEASDWFRLPDHLVFLDCQEGEAMRRLEGRGKKTSVERQDSLKAIRSNYLHALKIVMQRGGIPSMTIIDTTNLDLDAVVRRVWSSVSHDLPVR